MMIKKFYNIENLFQCFKTFNSSSGEK